MLKDCIDFSKGSQECQVHSGIQHVPTSELHVIVNPWPFRGWAQDLIGETRPTYSKSHKYILVGIDYFTKWIEAVPFGIPYIITTDQGLVFTGWKMQQFASKMGNNILTSTPYYAQANGQVEADNKVVIGLINKHFGKKPNNSDEIPSDHYWSMMLDEIVDLDEEGMVALDVLIRQKERVARAYNKKVKVKTFSIGDLVWKVIFPTDQRDRTLGKWYPNWESPFWMIQAFSNNAYEIEELTVDKF
ncbi:uncharacterized protein LOC127107460 [Lathyrus oleraceus]|uniref:uncharacterized protein LOC127107460 n=1 Tax=Pisum sativum TaxID=3888 RepID=UPI0021D05AA7|nr:uncharacterized protein LOC127107460 [Pisum sativum]